MHSNGLNCFPNDSFEKKQKMDWLAVNCDIPHIENLGEEPTRRETKRTVNAIQILLSSEENSAWPQNL